MTDTPTPPKAAPGADEDTMAAVAAMRAMNPSSLMDRMGIEVVEASAERGEEYLMSLLDADPGARYLGELGIGTNYGIRRASANVLFDEKLGGTVHLAIGRSYTETGGQNESSVHTDLVCDLRDGGELYADGDLIQENGRFLEFDLAGVADER